VVSRSRDTAPVTVIHRAVVRRCLACETRRAAAWWRSWTARSNQPAASVTGPPASPSHDPAPAVGRGACLPTRPRAFGRGGVQPGGLVQSVLCPSIRQPRHGLFVDGVTGGVNARRYQTHPAASRRACTAHGHVLDRARSSTIGGQRPYLALAVTARAGRLPGGHPGTMVGRLIVWRSVQLSDWAISPIWTVWNPRKWPLRIWPAMAIRVAAEKGFSMR